ncbi:MAG: Ig-like domain-containing protein [Chitinophagaceae bacterium]|nr:Ig-like domain-containing protein [Chitinophagaceae bacterium]
MKRFFFFFILILFSIQKIVVLSGCANIVPPQGGPKDSLPPVLLKADPVDSSRNFSETKITFSFDEYIDVQDIFNNLLVSPLPKTSPAVDYKLRTVTVKLKDTLEDNTTYTLNFGESIKDVNEGNIYKNFTYTFSTGSYLDSLELTGKVVLAENGKTDTTLIVMLHTSADDSVVVKEKPRYVARLDGKGNFHFKNLPPKTFYIYALKDEGSTRRYLAGKQLFGFADKPVDMQAKNDSVSLYAYIAKRDKQTVSSQPSATIPKPRGGAAGDNRLKFSNNLSNGQQDLLGSLKWLATSR